MSRKSYVKDFAKLKQKLRAFTNAAFPHLTAGCFVCFFLSYKYRPSSSRPSSVAPSSNSTTSTDKAKAIKQPNMAQLAVSLKSNSVQFESCRVCYIVCVSCFVLRIDSFVSSRCSCGRYDGQRSVRWK